MSVSDISKLQIPGARTDPSTALRSAQDDRIIDVPMSGQRSLATVTAEILAYQDAARRMAITYCIEVGRRLVEAKDMVSHGEWGSYLKEELGYSQSRANDLMRIFEAYAANQMRLDGDNLKHQAFGNLSYTQALALLVLPSEEERLAFVEEHDMAQISTRQIREELRRRTGGDGGEQCSPLRGTGEDQSTGLEGVSHPLQAGEVSEGDGDADSSTPLRSAQNDKARDSEAQRQSMDQIEAERELRMELIRANSRAKDAEAERDRILRETEESREKLDAAKAERDAARKAAEEAEQKAKATAEDLKKAQEAMKKALDAKKKAQDELKAARADKSVPAETLERLKREAEEAAREALEAEGGGKSVREAAAKLAEAEQAASEARRKADEMESNARRYAEEKEALEKQLRLAAPEMAVFKASFERVQGELLALLGSVDKLPEDKQAGAWKAMAALLGQASRIVEAHTEEVRS